MSGGSDLLHLKRLTWDAIESRTPATAARLAEELSIPVRSVCEWLDGESKPGHTHVLAMIKMTRAREAPRPAANGSLRSPAPPESAGGNKPSA
jgi:hypothetical protein